MPSALRVTVGCAITLVALTSVLQTRQVLVPSVLRGVNSVTRVPDDSPLAAARVALGRKLFFEARLSADGRMTCATCHDPQMGFADRRQRAVGVHGRIGERNSPSLVNRGYGEFFFWDGRAATLEAQVLMPIEDPKEMGASLGAVLGALARDAGYTREFWTAFGRAISREDLARALAAYVRSIQSGDAPWDRFNDGDRLALSADAQLGVRVFRSNGLCVTCHAGGNFTDERFHNTGIAWDGRAMRDRGREAVTGRPVDLGAFKTPSLREVASTAPYMHDGSLPTLEAVVDFYVQGGRPNPQLDSEMLPLNLSAAERRGLVAFLRALSGTVVEGVGPAAPARGVGDEVTATLRRDSR